LSGFVDGIEFNSFFMVDKIIKLLLIDFSYQLKGFKASIKIKIKIDIKINKNINRVIFIFIVIVLNKF